MKVEVRVRLAFGGSIFKRVTELADALTEIVRLKTEGFDAFYVESGAKNIDPIPATSYL